jgi:hypothetical protein
MEAIPTPGRHGAAEARSRCHCHGLFLPDVARWMRIDAGACVIGTIVAVVLMSYPDRRVGLG